MAPEAIPSYSATTQTGMKEDCSIVWGGFPTQPGILSFIPGYCGLDVRRDGVCWQPLRFVQGVIIIIKTFSAGSIYNPRTCRLPACLIMRKTHQTSHIIVLVFNAGLSGHVARNRFDDTKVIYQVYY